MSSGNPFGLSEISHFGSFQRVGGKAGGFINKKFFHPSSIRNQEKLWKAQTADEVDRRKQAELEKRREEERAVEGLRKQLYLAGQGKASDLFSSASQADPTENLLLTGGEKHEKRLAMEEEKRRKTQLKRDRTALEAEGDDLQTIDKKRSLAKSRYQEDVLVNGHHEVWGSWYSTDEKRWGFSCCKALGSEIACPLAPLEKATPQGDESDVSATGVEAETAKPGHASEQGTAQPPAAKKSEASLMDPRMFEAAERRKETKRLEDERKKAAKEAKESKSAYLNDLLNNPTDAG